MQTITEAQAAAAFEAWEKNYVLIPLNSGHSVFLSKAVQHECA